MTLTPYRKLGSASVVLQRGKLDQDTLVGAFPWDDLDPGTPVLVILHRIDGKRTTNHNMGGELEFLLQCQFSQWI